MILNSFAVFPVRNVTLLLISYSRRKTQQKENSVLHSPFFDMKFIASFIFLWWIRNAYLGQRQKCCGLKSWGIPPWLDAFRWESQDREQKLNNPALVAKREGRRAQRAQPNKPGWQWASATGPGEETCSEWKVNGSAIKPSLRAKTILQGQQVLA